MTTIRGIWRINANGSVGLLTLLSNDNISVNGSIAFDDVGGRVDVIEGGWNDAPGQIIFTRFLANSSTTQTFTGFLGSNHPDRLLLAGTFTESDVPASTPRTNFAWAAFSPIPI